MANQPLFNVDYDDSGLTQALRIYFDIRKNIDPKKELRRRAKNIGMRLIRVTKEATPSKAEIVTDATTAGGKKVLKSTTTGFRVRVRPSIMKRNVLWAKKVQMELRARVRSRTFTATGWFPAVERLGGTPRRKRGVRGPKRGRLVEKFGALEMSETLINDQPGAAQTMDRAEARGHSMTKVLEDERDDILKYVQRKQAEAARRAGLAP